MNNVTLLVTGHLRNFYENPWTFVQNHLGIFECGKRFLYTHQEIGWWTQDMSRSLSENQWDIDMDRVKSLKFFDDCRYIDKTDLNSVLSQYKTLAIHPDKAYWKESSYKFQIVHRYLALKQHMVSEKCSEDDIVILTRPDVLLKNPQAPTIIREAIRNYSEAPKEDLLFFCWEGWNPKTGIQIVPGDALIVGKIGSVLRTVSPEIYNTYEYVGFENLEEASNKYFNCKKIYVSDPYYFANSPGMKAHGK